MPTTVPILTRASDKLSFAAASNDLLFVRAAIFFVYKYTQYITTAENKATHAASTLGAACFGFKKIEWH